jgi:hypothetical protein
MKSFFTALCLSFITGLVNADLMANVFEVDLNVDHYVDYDFAVVSFQIDLTAVDQDVYLHPQNMFDADIVNSFGSSFKGGFDRYLTMRDIVGEWTNEDYHLIQEGHSDGMIINIGFTPKQDAILAGKLISVNWSPVPVYNKDTVVRQTNLIGQIPQSEFAFVSGPGIIPEPSTLLLTFFGLLALALRECKSVTRDDHQGGTSDTRILIFLVVFSIVGLFLLFYIGKLTPP